MTPEKITEKLDLHVNLTMKRDLQDAAMADDRKLSDYIRHVLGLHLYGIRGMAEHERACNGANRGAAGQSE